MQTTILTDSKEIWAIEEAWLRLLSESTCVRPFHTPLWFLKACEVRDDTPHLFCAWEGATLAGVFPLCRYREWWRPGHLGFPWWPAWEAPDLVVRSGDVRTARELVRAVYRNLSADGECALVNFHKDSNLVLGLSDFQETKEEDINYLLKARFPLPYIDLSQGWDSYLAAKSRNFRRTLHRIHKKLEERKLRFYLLGAGDPKIYEALQIHRERSSRRFGEKALHSGEREQKFFHETIPVLQQKGFFRCHVLEDEQSRITGCFFEAVRPPAQVFAYMMGCEEDTEEISPGIYLVTRAAQAAAEEGATLYDLGRWTSPFKERLKNATSLVYSLRLGGSSVVYDENEKSI